MIPIIFHKLHLFFLERMSQLEIENDKTRIQLGECQWQKDKTEENLDKISEAVDLTINKCKVIFKYCLKVLCRNNLISKKLNCLITFKF